MVANGYALLRAAVDAATVTLLRERIDTALRERGDGVDLRAGTQWIRDATLLGPEVEALARTGGVVEAAATLLGPEPAVVSAVMRNPVGATAQQALHVDWAGPIHGGADQQVQAMFYLDDVDAENGPTRLVPGSHRSGGVPSKRFADPHAMHPEQRLIAAAAGDVLVFSSHLWHSGTANHSGRPRRVITVTFRRAA